jgi:hypothetical protein
VNKLYGAILGAMFAVCSAASFLATPALADTPGAHPFYRHALADLRRAHHDVAVKGLDGDTKHPHDKACLQHIEDAISDVKQAGIDDGKPMAEAIPGDPVDHAGRLHRAEGDLRHALRDALKEETNNSTFGGHNSALHLQKRASDDIKLAISEVKLAIQFLNSEK